MKFQTAKYEVCETLSNNPPQESYDVYKFTL